jgi:carbamoyl-phosphate synthase large subunit
MATDMTCKAINQAGIPCERVNKNYEGRPNILDLITNGEIQMIVNTPMGKGARHDDSYLRKAAIKAKIPYVTTAAAGLAAAEGISHLKRKGKGLILPLQEWHAMIRDKD